jgi:hypothetical protein
LFNLLPWQAGEAVDLLLAPGGLWIGDSPYLNPIVDQPILPRQAVFIVCCAILKTWRQSMLGDRG